MSLKINREEVKKKNPQVLNSFPNCLSVTFFSAYDFIKFRYI